VNSGSGTNSLLEVEGLVASALLGSFNLKIVYCVISQKFKILRLISTLVKLKLTFLAQMLSRVFIPLHVDRMDAFLVPKIS